MDPHFYLLFDSMLRERGWFRCFQGTPVDEQGDPIPWMPYALIDFLDDRLTADLRVFEYGSGNSTRWFADHVNEVVAVEDDKEWFDRIRSSTPPNADIIHRTGDDYPAAIDKHGEFDVVVVDGSDRVTCAEMAIEHLTPGGIVLWDDSNEAEYQSKIEDLKGDGFKECFFAGLGPVTTNRQRTSVLYKQENCLNI